MLLAVHIADGVLTWPWLVGGFVVAAMLVALAFPLRDEDMPRTALLTAVFFVTSLFHVKCGPSSVHLLLGGLIGILLGRRAGLAIALGLLLQAALLGHGGFTTLGINTVVMTLPALIVGALFTLPHRENWVRRPWFRTLLITSAVFCWCETFVLAIAVLMTNPLTSMVQANVEPGYHLDVLDFSRALGLVAHPITVGLVLVVAAAAAWGERRLTRMPEFALGFLLGMIAVLLTIALNGFVLLSGGVDGWHTVVIFTFLAHLPLAALEGVIVGFVVGFLARVQPEMLRLPVAQQPETIAFDPGEIENSTTAMKANAPRLNIKTPAALLLAIVTLAGLPTPVFAHALRADYKVLPGQQVVVDSWFPAGDRPMKATVQVFRPDNSLLAEGPFNLEKGFTFYYDRQEDLRIVVNAPGGHRAEMTVKAAELQAKDEARATDPPLQDTSQPAEQGADAPALIPLIGRYPKQESGNVVTYKDVISGVALVLGLSAFILSVRNHQHLAAMRKMLTDQRGK